MAGKKKISIDKMMKAIEQAASQALSDDVFPIVKEAMQENIESVVYGAYTPKMYDRREYDGGLIADENIVGTMDGKLRLEVRNITPPADGPGYTTDKDLPAVVEYGTKSQYDFYDPDKPAGFANPRPFIEYTREDLNSRKKELSEIVAKRIIQNLKKTKF